MAQRVEVKFTDDLSGTAIAAGKGETVNFSLDGYSYEIDLNTKNAAALRKTLDSYVSAARPIKNSRGVRVKRTKIEADSRTVKEWARANGYEVNHRGRIPARIREAFEAAN